MSLLTIVQGAARKLPINVPATVIDNTDAQVQQLYGLADEIGEELALVHEWNDLTVDWSFTTTADPHAETRPADFGRLHLAGKVWRTNSLTPLQGPINSSQWIYLKNHVAGNYPGYWRNFGGKLNIIGIGTGEPINTEYVSKHWVRNAGDTERFAAWQDDTDLALVPEKLIRLALMWRWKHAKGLEYAEDMQTYERQLELTIAADRDAKPRSTAHRINEPDTQTTWPGQIVVN